MGLSFFDFCFEFVFPNANASAAGGLGSRRARVRGDSGGEQGHDWQGTVGVAGGGVRGIVFFPGEGTMNFGRPTGNSSLSMSHFLKMNPCPHFSKREAGYLGRDCRGWGLIALGALVGRRSDDGDVDFLYFD